MPEGSTTGREAERPKRTIRQRFAMPEWLVRAASTSWFGMLTTLFIIIAGVCASLFTEGIRGTGTSWIPQGTDVTAGLFFWCLVFLAATFFWLNHAAQTKVSARAQDQLSEAVKRLNTLPSELFLPTYARCWAAAAHVTFLCVSQRKNGALAVQDVEAAIRTVQAAIIESARDYDAADGRTKYSANIMLYRGEGDGFESAAPIDVVKESVGKAHADGYLELVPTLSTTVDEESERLAEDRLEDSAIKAVVLPVSNGPESARGASGKELLVVLPGAPYACTTGNCIVYSDMAVFMETLREGTTLDRRITDGIARYFNIGPGRHIRSFASFPILTGVKERPVLGILNLHSTEPGLLDDNGATLFAPVLAPFLTLLAALIGLRADALRSASSSASETDDDLLPPGTDVDPSPRAVPHLRLRLKKT